jgi:hypothetical protein
MTCLPSWRALMDAYEALSVSQCNLSFDAAKSVLLEERLQVLDIPEMKMQDLRFL